MELAPFLHFGKLVYSKRVGCQGFIGPLPSAFLDKKYFLRTAANIQSAFSDFQIPYNRNSEIAKLLL